MGFAGGASIIFFSAWSNVSGQSETGLALGILLILSGNTKICGIDSELITK